MAAIIGLEQPDVEAACAEAATGSVCQIANDNGGGQLVISGEKAAVEHAARLCTEKGAKRALMLQVSAPFHSALMAPAAETMREALATATKNTPAVPVVSNVAVQPLSDPDEIARRLVEQVTGRVRWRETVEWFGANGVTTLYEVGAGKVLSGLARRINRDIATSCHRHAGRRRGGAGGAGERELEHSRTRECSSLGRLKMFDLTGRKALVTGASGGIGEAIAAPARAGRDRRPARHAGRKARGAGRRTRRSDKTVPGQPVEPRRGQGARRKGRGRTRRRRHPGQQCRHHQGRPVRAHVGRGLGRRDGGEPDGGVPADPRTDPSDDAPPLRPHHQHHLGRRRHRQSRPDQLLRLQGRHDRLLEIAGAGDRDAQRSPSTAWRRASSNRP